MLSCVFGRFGGSLPPLVQPLALPLLGGAGGGGGPCVGAICTPDGLRIHRLWRRRALPEAFEAEEGCLQECEFEGWPAIVGPAFGAQ